MLWSLIKIQKSSFKNFKRERYFCFWVVCQMLRSHVCWSRKNPRILNQFFGLLNFEYILLKIMKSGHIYTVNDSARPSRFSLIARCKFVIFHFCENCEKKSSGERCHFWQILPTLYIKSETPVNQSLGGRQNEIGAATGRRQLLYVTRIYTRKGWEEKVG